MMAVRPVNSSNGVPSLQIMSVESHSRQGGRREERRKGQQIGHIGGAAVFARHFFFIDKDLNETKTGLYLCDELLNVPKICQ